MSESDENRETFESPRATAVPSLLILLFKQRSGARGVAGMRLCLSIEAGE